LKCTASGELKESYRVKLQHLETIDDWMQDRID